MFVLRAKIEIGKYIFRQVHEVKIEKRVTELSQKAFVKLPISFVVGNEKKRLEDLIKHEDKVSIKLWYKDYEQHAETFTGYVRQTHHNQPVVIECENDIGLLRKKTIHKRWTNTSIKTILKDVLGGVIPLDCKVDLTLKSFTSKRASAYSILLKLKENYGLDMYVNRNGALYCGLRQTIPNADRVVYKLHQNVIKSNLKWQSQDDIRLNIKAVAILPDDQKIEVQVGDPEGETRTLHFYNIESKSKLKALALSEIELYKFSGYRGYLKTFLVPKSQIGDTAIMLDEDYPSRDGNYFINGVVTTFGTSGARRKVELGRKV